MKFKWDSVSFKGSPSTVINWKFDSNRTSHFQIMSIIFVKFSLLNKPVGSNVKKWWLFYSWTLEEKYQKKEQDLDIHLNSLFFPSGIQVANSVIMNHVTIGDGCSIQGSVICSNVQLQERVNLKDCQVISLSLSDACGWYLNINLNFDPGWSRFCGYCWERLQRGGLG